MRATRILPLYAAQWLPSNEGRRGPRLMPLIGYPAARIPLADRLGWGTCAARALHVVRIPVGHPPRAPTDRGSRAASGAQRIVNMEGA